MTWSSWPRRRDAGLCPARGAGPGHHPLGLWLVLSLRRPGRHLRPARQPLPGHQPGARVHGRHRRAHPVRGHDHRSPSAGPAGWCSSASGGSAAIAAVVLVLCLHAATDAILLDRVAPASACGPWSSSREPSGARDIALTLFEDYLFAFEALGVLLLAAVIGGLYLARRDDGHARDEHRRAGHALTRRRAREPVAGGLPHPLGAALRHRHLRLPGQAQRHRHADVHRADAQRGQPGHHRLRCLHAGARRPGLAPSPCSSSPSRPARPPSAWPSSSPSTATAGRRSSTSTRR